MSDGTDLKMAQLLTDTLMALNRADGIYASDNAYRVAAGHDTTLLPFAAVNLARRTAFLRLADGSESRAQELEDTVGDCGESVEYCLTLLRKGWAAADRRPTRKELTDLAEIGADAVASGTYVGYDELMDLAQWFAARPRPEPYTGDLPLTGNPYPLV
jgi:hypothetical protein